MFIPTTREELTALGWDQLDVILVSGDSYLDTPLMVPPWWARSSSRPDSGSGSSPNRMSIPTRTSPASENRPYFWGVTGGTVDSMVANYTATRRKRKSDDFTPGRRERSPARPRGDRLHESDQALFRPTCPIVLGGIEASLRRVAHYDYWSDALRAPILFDSKADYLLYGMADQSILELAVAIQSHRDPRAIRGLCYLGKEIRKDISSCPRSNR